MTKGMPGVLLFSIMKKKTIVFIDGNNWYHNCKALIDKPRIVDFKKLCNLISEHFDLDIKEIRYYNSIPDIESGDDVYYKHMVFLANLKKQGVLVFTRKLKKVRQAGKILRIEKGIDIMIAADMVNKSLIEKDCECCLLITGDSDYVPVMQLIKKAKKEVITSSVLRGYARELLQGEFRFWILKKEDLNKCIGRY